MLSLLSPPLPALLLVVTDLLLNNISEAVDTENPRIMSAIIVTGLAPAVVSYYWCAALQLGATGVGRAATVPSTVCGAILHVVSAMLIAVPLSMSGFVPAPHRPGSGFIVFGMGLALAGALGFTTCGIHAAVGGYVVDRLAGWRALLALGGVMLAVGVAQVAVATAAIWMLGHKVNPLSYGNFLGGIAGWYLGLLASGIRQLAMRKQASPAAVPA